MVSVNGLYFSFLMMLIILGLSYNFVMIQINIK
jgi:hypothetical protein